MKKLLSVILTVTMLLFAFTAFAETQGNPPPGDPPGGFDGGNPPGDPPGDPPDGFGGGNPPPDGFGGGNPPGGGAADVTYTATAEISSATAEKTQVNGTYASETADENALLITEAAVTLENPSVTKTGDSDGNDSCSFYGLNAAVLVKDGADAVITGGTVESSATGANVKVVGTVPAAINPGDSGVDNGSNTGKLSFWQRIIAFFRSIGDFFRNMFSR